MLQELGAQNTLQTGFRRTNFPRIEVLKGSRERS